LHPGSIPGEASNFPSAIPPKVLRHILALVLAPQTPLMREELWLGEKSVTIDFAAQRRTMVEGQLRTYDVSDSRLLAVMESVPRERFVPESRKSIAYIDQPMPVAEHRVMLTPMVFARLVQALEIEAGDAVLDVACGTGYSSVILAGLGAHVTALDDVVDAELIKRNCEGLEGAEHIRVVGASLEKGAPDHGPFDTILVNGSVEAEPESLFGQLKEGGRLGVILGAGRSGKAMIFRKSNGHVSGAAVFDAAAPNLPVFKRTRTFIL
jgi:protein-L-isoaspartate(D-aspartate) O-methyltransferase